MANRWGNSERLYFGGLQNHCITDSMDVSLSKLRELVMEREAWHAAIHGVMTERLNWTELKITADGDCSHEIKRCLLLGKVMTNLDSILRSRDIPMPTKVRLVKAMVFPVVMYGCESWTIKKSWALKNWCFWSVALEKTLESSLDCKEIQPFHPKGNQSRIFIRRTDAEAETLIVWPPDAKNWLIWKDPDAGEE